MITCDQDDSLYAALDHATKIADVDVVYAKSHYAGSAHASGPLSGEITAVLSADDPESIEQAVTAVRFAIENLFAFEEVLESDGVTFFAVSIGSIGKYLSTQASLTVGAALGYLIAPPAEAIVALDAALKSSEVTLARFFGPPTETNFAGGYVTGTLDAVTAATRAFSATVIDVAQRPLVR